ncbi:MAG: ATP-binding protein [Pseudomonadota bacterium]
MVRSGPVIDRRRHRNALGRLLRRFAVVGLLGARQVGKTTLARAWLGARAQPGVRFDLENPDDLARLADPVLALGPARGIVVLDEIQRRPELFPVLRVLADRRPLRARFLALGSASPALLRQGSESLAGRIAYYELPGLSLAEAGPRRAERLWLRGGFPRAFLAGSDAASLEWRRAFLATFLERDLPGLGVNVAAATMRRFWTMLAHHHGQLWNASEFGRSFGVADTTVRGYLDRLSDAFVVRQLQPWHENIGKRQVRAPKVYVRDSGLLHALLDIRTPANLEVHPKVGASWEGFILEQLIQQLGATPESCYFWRTHTGAELDLLVVRGGRRLGFEIKRTTAPGVTPSMRSALADLKLDALAVVHAGGESFPLAPRVRAVSWRSIVREIG